MCEFLVVHLASRPKLLYKASKLFICSDVRTEGLSGDFFGVKQPAVSGYLIHLSVISSFWAIFCVTVPVWLIFKCKGK